MAKNHRNYSSKNADYSRLEIVDLFQGAMLIF